MITVYKSANSQVRRLCCMTAICCYVASMCYFLMAGSSGWVAIEVEFVRDGQVSVSQGKPTRQIFWIRYISWYVCMLKQCYAHLTITKAGNDSDLDD